MILRTNRHNGHGPAPAPEVRPIALHDLPRVRLPDRFQVTTDELKPIVASYPARSFWVPSTGECAIILPWRHRMELPSLAYLSAFDNEAAVMAAVIESARAAGSKALIFLDALEYRRASFYTRYGFVLLERILTLELVRATPPIPRNGAGSMQFFQLSPMDAGAVVATTALDHRAFPWLWWNTLDEFRVYLDSAGVEVWVGTIGAEIVSYVGITHFPGWGHLDRIAVSPDHQRQGLGRVSLEFAIQRMRQRGAHRIGLSTQGDNERSQQLYTRAGFRRTPEHDYSVYGVVFDRQMMLSKDD